MYHHFICSKKEADIWFAEKNFNKVNMPVMWLCWNDDCCFSINSNSKSYAKKYFTRAEILFGAAYQFQSDFNDRYQNLLEMENKTDDMRKLIEYNLKYMFYFHHLINKLKEIKQTIYQK